VWFQALVEVEDAGNCIGDRQADEQNCNHG
jgi:hypothetical protein